MHGAEMVPDTPVAPNIDICKEVCKIRRTSPIGNEDVLALRFMFQYTFVVHVENKLLSIKTHIYILSSYSFHIVGDSKLNASSLQAVAENLAHCIEITGQLVHISCCGMAKVVKANVAKPLVSEKLSEVCRDPFSTSRYTIGLGEHQIAVVVSFTCHS